MTIHATAKPLPPDVDRFYRHIAECALCGIEHDHDSLCQIGAELLFECVDELPEHWQRIAGNIRYREELKREADANFEFYKNCEEL